MILSSFDQPDETRTFEKGRFEIVRVSLPFLGADTYTR